jgi:hypothetical protein
MIPVYFSEQPQVAVGLGTGRGQTSPGCLSTQPVCTSHKEARTHLGEKQVSLLQVPASSIVAREVLPCPKSASREKRVEGWGGIPGLNGLWPSGKVRGSESFLAGS